MIEFILPNPFSAIDFYYIYFMVYDEITGQPKRYQFVCYIDTKEKADWLTRLLEKENKKPETVTYFYLPTTKLP